MRIEAEEAKGRKDQDEGGVGRKGESLESEDELPKELGQEDAENRVGKPGCVEGDDEGCVPGVDEADRPEYEVRNIGLPADPYCPLKPRLTSTTLCT